MVVDYYIELCFILAITSCMWYQYQKLKQRVVNHQVQDAPGPNSQSTPPWRAAPAATLQAEDFSDTGEAPLSRAGLLHLWKPFWLVFLITYAV